MTECKYCGRSDHGVVDCWQKSDHAKMKLEFIRADHCLSCLLQDLDKKKETAPKEEPKGICKHSSGEVFERHQWVLCESAIVPEPPETVKQYLFICPDCEIKKIASYALH